MHGRALVFKLCSASDIWGLRVSSLAVVVNTKFCIIHDLTVTRAGGHSRGNDDTDYSSSHVLRDVLLRVLFLRQMHGAAARIVHCRVDVKDAVRQVSVDPVGAPVFGYAMGEYVVVDFRLQFGWRNSPEVWGLMASAMQHAHTHSTFQDAAVSPQGAAAIEHERFAPPRGISVRSNARDCRTGSGSGGYAGRRFFRVVRRRRRHSCRGSVVAGRSSLCAGCVVVGVGPLSLVGRTWRVRPSSFVRQQNH